MKQQRTRDRGIHVRLAEDELDYIQRRAKAAGLTISNYIRLVALNADIKTTVIGWPSMYTY